MLHALLFSDDTETIVRLSDVFRETGFAVHAVGSLPEARSAMLREMPDVALMDYEALGADGISFLENSGLANVIELMLMTADANLENVPQDLRAVATETFPKPLCLDRLKTELERIVTVATQPATDHGEIVKAAGLGIMHGNSAPMRRFFALVRKVSRTDMTVLLVGESGVGKELGAQMIHALGDRSAGPLVAVNCGAISPEILESELFGHEKGSFTGASRRHVGLFERASGGTLFLDEVTEMSAALQVKLLRAIESGRVRRVGGEQELQVDVRIVAATNRDPGKAMRQGVLREDLYYRLAQFPIRIPALRERGDDVLVLAERFLAELNAANRVVKEFSPKSLELLRLHTWPGNVRELRNAVCRAYVLAAETIEPDDLPPSVVEGGPNDKDHLRMAVGLPLAEVERRAILATVEHLDGDKKAAAQVLGVSLKTLYTKLKQYRGG
jgi:DNA-binding NtrC family response regulator